MLESIDFCKEPLSKESYKAEYDGLVKELVVLQQEAHRKGVGVVVLFEGWDGAGKGSRISDLLYNMDARATTVHMLDETPTTDFEGSAWGVTGYYPEMQEFWKALGCRGDITFYDRGWYARAAQNMLLEENSPLARATRARLAEKLASEKGGKKGKKAKGEMAPEELSRAMASALSTELARSEERSEGPLRRHLIAAHNFERQLVDDGYIVIKFFLHVSKEAQRSRLQKLWDNPETRWRVSKEKLRSTENYDAAYVFYDSLLEGSNFVFAPWQILNGEDKRETNLAIVRTLVNAIKGRLDEGDDPEAAAAAAKAQANSAAAAKGAEGGAEAKAVDDEAAKLAAAIADAEAAKKLAPKASRFITLADYPRLDEARHDLVLDQDEYKKQLKYEQKRFAKLEMEMYQKRVPLILMYEGQDAAGKGGSIKRVAQALDARAYTIFPSPAPTKPELMHPFLWRYWTRLPKAGHVGIYDRSWYGRVLVERVEGFASPSEWARAYDEINEFERDLVRWGALIVKFWVEISSDEQLNRFKARQEDPTKQWKITEEDWRNREKAPQYKAAIEDMLRLTSTPHAPWTLLESDDKRYARVKALRVINDALEARLHG